MRCGRVSRCPGILPPVIDGDALLVDGAVINNFPTDVMAATHRGLTIGIDVARRGVIDIEAFRDPPGFLFMDYPKWGEGRAADCVFVDAHSDRAP